MYTWLASLSLILLLLIGVYRQRSFFASLLPQHIQDRLPPLLRADDFGSSTTQRPSMLSRIFPTSWTASSGYNRLGAFDWNSSLRAGLNSTLFDIETNIRDGDSRSGLDERGAMDVQAIMQQYGVSFDEARLIRHKQILANNNIDPQTGLPLDSKAVTSLGGTIGNGSSSGA